MTYTKRLKHLKYSELTAEHKAFYNKVFIAFLNDKCEIDEMSSLMSVTENELNNEFKNFWEREKMKNLEDNLNEINNDKTAIATAIKKTYSDLKTLVYQVNKYEIDSDTLLYRNERYRKMIKEHPGWKTFKHTSQYYTNQKHYFTTKK